jgi:hypothetical protein
MRIGFVGGVTNITEIPNRSHSDLQNLDVDDHKQYSHLIGLDSAKPSTGILPGTLYFATDTQKLYRYDGTNWIYVKTIASFLDLLDTPSSYTGYSNKVLKVKATGDGIEFGSAPPPEKAYYISNDIYAAKDAEVTTSNNTPTLVQSFTLPSDFPPNTLVRVYFEIIPVTTLNTAYGRIYKNNSPYGTIRSNPYYTGWGGFVEDLSFSNGDNIQLYIWSSVSGSGVKARYFRILGTTIPPKYTIS